MPITIKETNGGKVVEVDLSGKIIKEDYGKLVPVVERVVKHHGKIQALVVMNDFHG